MKRLMLMLVLAGTFAAMLVGCKAEAGGTVDKPNGATSIGLAR